MKKRLVLLGALAVVIVLLAVVTLLTRKSHAATPCLGLIAAIRENKTSDSYELFTPDAKTLTTPESWAKQVKNLYGAYYDPAKPEPKLKKEAVTGTDEGGRTSEKSETYVISSGDSRYTVTCNLKLIEDKFLVDGFTSKASSDPSDYRKIESSAQQ